MSITTKLQKLSRFLLESFQCFSGILYLQITFLIPNPSLIYSYVVLNFWPNLSLVVLIKLFLGMDHLTQFGWWGRGGGGRIGLCKNFLFHWQVVQTMF